MAYRIENLKPLLSHFMSRYETYGPVRERGFVTYQKLKNPEEVVTDFSVSDMSAKALFFPETQYVCFYELGKDPKMMEVKPETGARVIFGLRPCDIKALKTMDLVFLQEPALESYKAQRDRSILVGLACEVPSEECFCQSFGEMDMEGFDILLTPQEGCYAMEVMTEKGEKALEGFKPGGDIKTRRKAMPQKRHIDLKRLEELNEKLMDDSHVWDKLAEGCINCRVCTYVCPTCHCFTITEERFKDRGARAIVWDSCMNRNFTKMAGGANPRASNILRLKQRIMHKFFYYPERFNSESCVGCGRCIKACPMNRDITGYIEEILEGVTV